jgi:hypothetical protein
MRLVLATLAQTTNANDGYVLLEFAQPANAIVVICFVTWVTCSDYSKSYVWNALHF